MYFLIFYLFFCSFLREFSNWQKNGITMKNQYLKAIVKFVSIIYKKTNKCKQIQSRKRSEEIPTRSQPPIYIDYNVFNYFIHNSTAVRAVKKNKKRVPLFIIIINNILNVIITCAHSPLFVLSLLFLSSLQFSSTLQPKYGCSLWKLQSGHTF